MSQHRIVIEPGTADRHYWRDLWKFRGLFWFLAWRDILVRYKQTVIGVLWSVLRPLLTLGVMAFLGWLFNSEVPGTVPRLLLVAAATLPWTFFSSAFTDASNSLITNSNLLTKVYFPRLIIPTSTMIVCLIDLLISFSILIVIMLAYDFMPDARVLLLPVFLLMGLASALGAGVLVAALNVKYRDFRYVVPFIVQLGLFVSPIAFITADVPERWRALYALNPMVGIIDGFRWSILGGRVPLDLVAVASSGAVAGAVLVAGVWYFRRTERGFADVI